MLRRLVARLRARREPVAKLPPTYLDALERVNASCRADARRRHPTARPPRAAP